MGSNVMAIEARQGIIVAAGRGSRMGDVTAEKPKCLAVLAGRTLLDWQLAALEAGGMRSIAVVGGYRKDLLASSRYRLLDNPEWSTTNMVGTLRCAAALLRGAPCIVSYSDIVYRPDRVAALAAADADIAISYDTQWESLWRARFADPLADAETFRESDGWLTTIGERAKAATDIQGQYIGLLKFTPSGWAETERALSTLAVDVQRRIDVTSLLRVLLARGARIRCVAGAGAWCEVDNGTDLQLYQRLLAESSLAGTRWEHDWRW
jgi:L-glutamine-phosphate cytidylyltransferase